MSEYTVNLAGQLCLVTRVHTENPQIRAAKEASAKPALYQDWDDVVPWCMFCGEENGHSEDCLVPHLRVLAHAHSRLLEQVEQLIGLLEREDVLNPNSEEDEEHDDVDDLGDVYRGHPGRTAPVRAVDVGE